MSDPTAPTRQTTTVQCETHGLRYNPNVHSGCVRCRKEAGETIGRAPTTKSPASGSGAYPGAAPPPRMLPALGVTLLLITLTGGSFFWVHQQFYEPHKDRLQEFTEAMVELQEELQENSRGDLSGDDLSDDEAKVIDP